MKHIIALLVTLTVAVSMLSGCSLLETPRYAVTFNLNGGTRVGGGTTLQEVEEGAAAQAPEVEKEGYVFEGWDKDLSSITENTTVNALWSSLLTVSFDAGEGSLVSGEAVQTLKEGETPVAPEVERDKYVFDGWSPAVGPVTEDTTYTALWTEKKYSAEEIYEILKDSMVEITIYDINGDSLALGSGFFIDEEGTLVTNYHVIEGAYYAEAMCYDESVYEIDQVLGFDEALDLAIVHVNIPASVAIEISDRTVVTGETVYALGSSEGLTGTFSEGIVSTVSRTVDGKECIQITAPISHGNSGGPCVNEYCEVIGINSMMYVEGQNLNFAIKIHELDKLDLSNPLTLPELYEMMGYASVTTTYSSAYGGEGNVTIVDTGDEGMYVYDDADLVEWEENNTVEWADILVNGLWTAGYLDYSADDIDVYSLTLEEDCSNLWIVYLPYYIDDADTTDTLFMSEDAETVLLSLEKIEEEDYTYLALEMTDVAAGTYYLALAACEDYPYQVGPYYQVYASWE